MKIIRPKSNYRNGTFLLFKWKINNPEKKKFQMLFHWFAVKQKQQQ